jgi:AcrR family transcriptional regulator
VRSTSNDRTTRAVIRDEALRLFAAHGPDAVTVRQIAAAARVSPGLVIHHFTSKEGLRDAVDQHVLATFEVMLGEMTTGAGPELFDPAATGSLTELMATHLPPASPIPDYLRRLLLSDTEASRVLFRRLFDVSQATLAALAQAGLASPGRDPAVRAALLLANDLAVLLLRDRLADALGVDPLSREGMARWAGEMLTIYGAGLLAPPDSGQISNEHEGERP